MFLENSTGLAFKETLGSATCCVSLNKVLYCLKPQFPHVKNVVIMLTSQYFYGNLILHLPLAMIQKLEKAPLATNFYVQSS